MLKNQWSKIPLHTQIKKSFREKHGLMDFLVYGSDERICLWATALRKISWHMITTGSTIFHPWHIIFYNIIHTIWDKCNTTYEYYSYLESKGLVKGNFSPKSSGNHHLSYHSLTFNCNPNSTRYLLFERWIEIFSTLSTYLCYTYAIGICLKNENYSAMIYYYTERFYY